MLVRYYGHVGQTMGFGRAATDLCLAMIRAGVELEVRPLSPPAALDFTRAQLPVAECVRPDDALTPNPDVIIVHTLPVDCAAVLGHVGIAPGVSNGPVLIAYTTWEAMSAPRAISDGLNLFDQVWVPSGANARAFDDGHLPTHKVQIVPHGVDEETFESTYKIARPPRAENSPYRFYYVGAWNTRKNPEGVMRAYGHAFTKADNVELVIQARTATAVELAATIGSLGLGRDMPAIRLSNRDKSNEEIAQVHLEGDCYVTASRGEAWNLPAFDAMLYGNRVIAPRGLGSDDFLKATSAMLYGSSLTPARIDVAVTEVDKETGRIGATSKGAQMLDCKVVWLEPHLTQLAANMRSAYDAHHHDPTAQGIHTNYDPLKAYGFGPIGTLAKTLIAKGLAARNYKRSTQ